MAHPIVARRREAPTASPPRPTIHPFTTRRSPPRIHVPSWRASPCIVLSTPLPRGAARSPRASSGRASTHGGCRGAHRAASRRASGIARSPSPATGTRSLAASVHRTAGPRAWHDSRFRGHPLPLPGRDGADHRLPAVRHRDMLDAHRLLPGTSRDGGSRLDSTPHWFGSAGSPDSTPRATRRAGVRRRPRACSSPSPRDAPRRAARPPCPRSRHPGRSL